MPRESEGPKPCECQHQVEEHDVINYAGELTMICCLCPCMDFDTVAEEPIDPAFLRAFDERAKVPYGTTKRFLKDRARYAEE